MIQRGNAPPPRRRAANQDRHPAQSMSEPIPDTPENVARACLLKAPKKRWCYLAPPKHLQGKGS